MNQLRDIKGLNPVSIWPLAYGWWIILAVLAAIIIGFVVASVIKKRYQNSWKFAAEEQLVILRSNLNQAGIVGEIFELLKEVSIKKFGRKKCANLTGLEWLQWLQENDSNKFNWVKNGKELVEIQYAPSDKIAKILAQDDTRNSLRKILVAISNLIKK